MAVLDTARDERLHLNGSVLGAGPAIAGQRRRSYATWAALALVGLLPTIAGAGDFVRAAGLGLWFPGAGFLADGSWWWAVVALLLFALALAGWLGVGGFVFPLTVWVGSAVLAGAVATDVDGNGAGAVVAVVAVALVGRAGAAQLLRRSRARTAADLAEHLGAIAVTTPSIGAGVAGELDEEDLAAARYVLDLALQPIEEFDGFTTIDQFREAAWRYQLVSINYALASLQVNYAPAFRGYLLQAQANAVTKMLDRRVWHYWRIENLIGNLKLGADPVRSENIMLSGWWALALGAFENATGDRRFSEPGALTFRESERRSYAYDYPPLVDTLVRQFDDRELCFFPCEPNWVFAICNLFGLTGILAYDNAHGTTIGQDRVERFARTLEREYTTADGRFVMISSRRTGLRVASGSPISPSSISWLTNMLSPRLAQTYWEIGRRAMATDGNGRLEDYQVPLAAAIDPGSYRPNNAYFWASLMLSARELGDAETYAVARERMAANGSSVDAGVLTYRGSTYANLTAHAGRFGSEGTWHRFAWGESASSGSDPHVAEAAYPEVLVARAVTDGRALDVVLRPGGPGSSPQAVGVAGLVAGRPYRVNQAGTVTQHVADHDGRLSLLVPILGRTEIRVEPID